MKKSKEVDTHFDIDRSNFLSTFSARFLYFRINGVPRDACSGSLRPQSLGHGGQSSIGGLQQQQHFDNCINAIAVGGFFVLDLDLFIVIVWHLRPLLPPRRRPSRHEGSRHF